MLFVAVDNRCIVCRPVVDCILVSLSLFMVLLAFSFYIHVSWHTELFIACVNVNDCSHRHLNFSSVQEIAAELIPLKYIETLLLVFLFL